MLKQHLEHKKYSYAFSVVELLLVLALSAIFIMAGFMVWRNLLFNARFNEYVQTVVQEANRVRTDSRRSAVNHIFSWDALGQSLHVIDAETGAEIRTIALPFTKDGSNNVAFISSGNGQILYTAPYGRVGSIANGVIRIESPNGKRKTDILMVGVTGKIMRIDEPIGGNPGG